MGFCESASEGCRELSLFSSPLRVFPEYFTFFSSSPSFPSRLSVLSDTVHKMKSSLGFAVSTMCESVRNYGFGKIGPFIEGTSAAFSGIDGFHLAGLHPSNMFRSFFLSHRLHFHSYIFPHSFKKLSGPTESLRRVQA